jgi:hypothetical protein
MAYLDVGSDVEAQIQTYQPLPQPSLDQLPPIGVTPPRVLAREAAEGRRGAAWRLMHLLVEEEEEDGAVMSSVASLGDDRLARFMIEFLASGTWAGKPFTPPPAVYSSEARTRLRSMFLPEAGMDPARAERVLLEAVHDAHSPLRAEAAFLLGFVRKRTVLPALLEALHDPTSEVRLQAVRGLGQLGDSVAVAALLDALSAANEVLANQIFHSLVKLGYAAVPALIATCSNPSPWIRWQCMRALGEIGDPHAISALALALADNDRSVAWMAARSLHTFGACAVGLVLQRLITAETLPWLIETAWYVLHEQAHQHKELQPYLEPVLRQMRSTGYRIATASAAQSALEQLRAHPDLKTLISC